MSWPLLWVAQLDINAQAEAQTQDRNLEKTADSIEGHSVVFYSASFGASRKIEGNRVISWNLRVLFCEATKGHKLP